MGQTLTNGIYLPDEGERNSYSGLEANWRTLDALILTINGKAAPNAANTWTAAQTFTAGITGDLTGNVTGNVTGDLTGTASKAIADEDGTNIKTGYVNCTTNQSIAGQKTFFDNIFFSSPVYHKNTTYEIGNIPASNIVTNIYFADKNSVYTGFARNAVYSSGRSATEIRAKNTFKNGVLNPTGSDISSNLNVEVQPDGSKTLYFDGSIRNNVLPYVTNTYSLGSSSYQWSSVYAQTYYYNGTAWGLDKANVWSDTQMILSNFPKNIGIKNTSLTIGEPTPSSDKILGTYVFKDSTDSNIGFLNFEHYKSGDVSSRWYVRYKFDNGTKSTSGSMVGVGVDVGFDNSGNKFLKAVTNADTDLGTATNKWKTLNGVNPGALSLPDKDNSVDITSEFTDLTGGDIFYIPPADGWITITADNEIFCAVVSSTRRTTFWRQSASATSISNACVTIPVKYLQHFRARIKSTNAITVTFYPCQGNV